MLSLQESSIFRSLLAKKRPQRARLTAAWRQAEGSEDEEDDVISEDDIEASFFFLM